MTALQLNDYQDAIPDLRWLYGDWLGTCPSCHQGRFEYRIYRSDHGDPVCSHGCTRAQIEAAVRSELSSRAPLPLEERPPHPAQNLAPPPPKNGRQHDPEPQRVTRFPLISFDDLRNLPPPEYQVEDFFHEQTFVQVFGETNHGKSLLIWDLCCNIARGSETWFGRQIVKHGPVVWINADGGRGLTLRANAWAEAHGSTMRHPLWTLMGSVRLNKVDEMTAFRLQLLEMDPRPVLVVFDTQSRCMPGGDENDQGVMTAVTEFLHRLKMEVGCTVMPIHHTDKTGQWERGSGVVKNESDTQIRVNKDEASGIFTVSCRKARDGCPFRDFYFALHPAGESVVIVQSDVGPEKEVGEKKAHRRDQMLQIILNEPGVTCEVCSDRMNISLRTAQRYADELKALKIIVEAELPRGERGGTPPHGLFANPGGG